MSRGDVFERNLERLLRRAYRPAPCRPAFRQTVLESILRQVETRARVHRGRGIRAMALAAAVLVSAGVSIVLFLRDPPRSENAWLQSMGAAAAGSAGDAGTPVHGTPSAVAPRELAHSGAAAAFGAPDPGAKSALSESVRRFSGKVVDAISGQSLDSFVVTWTRAADIPSGEAPRVQRFESEAGEFEIELDSGGEWEVLVSSPGHAVERRLVRIGAETDLTPVPFALGPGARVRGQVLDGATHQPVADALVVSESDAPRAFLAADASAPPPFQRAARTGPDGRFELGPVAEGVQVLRVSRPDYGPAWSETFDVRRGDVKGDLVIRLVRGGTIVGRVHPPLPTNATGRLVLALQQGRENRRLWTGAYAGVEPTGTFEIEGLPLGMHSVVLLETVKGKARPIEVVPCVVEAGRAAHVAFGAERKGTTLRGRVIGAVGPDPGASITLTPKGNVSSPLGPWMAAVLGPDGRFALEGLEPRTHEVYFASRGGATVVKLMDLDIPDAASFSAEFPLEAGAVEGSVRRAPSDDVVEGAVVILERLEPSSGRFEFHGRTHADRSGMFSLPYVAAGTYDVTLYSIDGSLGAERTPPFSVDAGEVRALGVVRLGAAGSIRVRVRDGKGAPVSGASIEFFDATGRSTPFGVPPLRSSAEGIFFAAGVKPGPWRVRARAADGKFCEGSATVRERETAIVELVLPP